MNNRTDIENVPSREVILQQYVDQLYDGEMSYDAVREFDEMYSVFVAQDIEVHAVYCHKLDEPDYATVITWLIVNLTTLRTLLEGEMLFAMSAYDNNPTCQCMQLYGPVEIMAIVSPY